MFSVHDVINRIFSRDSNSVAAVFMWPKFNNPRISMRELIITLVIITYHKFDQKNYFFEGWSWFKFDNLGLVLSMKFYGNVSKGFELEVGKFWGGFSTFGEVIGEKLVEGIFASPILNTVNTQAFCFKGSLLWSKDLVKLSYKTPANMQITKMKYCYILIIIFVSIYHFS